jgi:hypothetical protein
VASTHAFSRILEKRRHDPRLNYFTDPQQIHKRVVKNFFGTSGGQTVAKRFSDDKAHQITNCQSSAILSGHMVQ